MTIFLNARTLLIFSVCVVNTYIVSSAFLDVINLGEVRTSNFDDLYGWSEPIINLYFERFDPFMVELQSYNYGATNPLLWTAQDVIDHVNDNLQRARVLLDQVKEIRSVPLYQPETFSDFLKRLPTYQEVASGTKVFNGSEADIRDLIGDLRLYFRPDKFPQG